MIFINSIDDIKQGLVYQVKDRYGKHLLRVTSCDDNGDFGVVFLDDASTGSFDRHWISEVKVGKGFNQGMYEFRLVPQDKYPEYYL